MLNLSQLARASSDVSLKNRVIDLVEPELYKAENVADYRGNKSLIVPPWFKQNPFLSSNYYALVLLYNVGIDAIFEDDKLLDNYVKAHDGSDFAVMCWTKSNDIFPAEKSYSEMLESGELKPQDWVYRLLIRHSYDGGVPFVVGVSKGKFSNLREEKMSLADKITSLFPDFEPGLQPQY